MALITYDDKVSLNENPQVADVNKVTASDMNEIKESVNENYNTFDAFKTDKTLKKLWENPNMNTGYTTGTIELSSDDYDYLIWICEGYNGWKRMISYFAPKGLVPELFYAGSGQMSDGINWRIANYNRLVTRIDDTHFQVALPSLSGPNGDSYSGNGINNGNWIIPRYIYGGKF